MAAKVWSRTVGDANWSTAANWNGGTVPATTDTITFDATSLLDCTIDALGTWSAGTFTVTGGYTGTITQNVAMTTAAWAYSSTGPSYQQNANLTTTTFALTGGVDGTGGITGHVVNSGNFQCSSFSMVAGLIDFTGVGTCLWTGAVAITSTALPGPSAVKIVAPPGILESRGSWSQAGGGLINFVAGSGTVNLTAGASQTIDVDSITFNLVTENKTGGTLTIAAGTTVPFGASPTTTNNTGAGMSISGTVTVSGDWTNIGDLVIGAGGVVSGALSSISINNGDFNINATATFPASVPFTMDGINNDTLTSTVTVLGLGTFNQNGALTIAAGTSVTLASGSQIINQPTINGTLIVPSGSTLTCSGVATFGAASTLTGPGTIICGSGFTMNATGTVTGGANIINVTMTPAGGSTRTFAGASKTYGVLTINGSAGSNNVTITGTNTFGSIVDILAISSHTITFPNVTTTVGAFTVKGSAGKIVTLQRTGAAGTFTLTKSTAGDVTGVDFISVSNSTVDAAPVWYAGANSTNGGGNTNWIFTAAPNDKQRKSFFVIS